MLLQNGVAESRYELSFCNDVNATQPTLALAQQLWDEPEKVLAIADPAHSLWRYGLVTIFLGIRERKDLADISLSLLLSIVDVPNLSYGDRINCWKQALSQFYLYRPSYHPDITNGTKKFAIATSDLSDMNLKLEGSVAGSTADWWDGANLRITKLGLLAICRRSPPLA
ncbi:MAG: hypothetical protein HXY43_14435 [Fischerella sp.]|uniref:hypothetical protein n=1 Tax=Fischerella sp. TaxID=1191 RepID=UPI0018150D25|nr:hypothetical protein [Fischerella sp.]NWF60417.1 hypothetical protein [Fischerella sp.]